MKYFKPPFEVANIEKQYQELRQAFEIKPGIYAPGINEVDQEYQICLRLCKVLEGKPRVSKPYFPNANKKRKRPQKTVINRTTIVIDPNKIIDLAQFIASLLKKE